MTVPPDSPPLRVEVGRRVPAGTKVSGEFTYSIVEPLPVSKPRGDRREEDRTRSRLREGQVAERRGRVLVDCRIRDRSKRGARLQLEKDRPRPKAFLLTDAATQHVFRAVLAWQRGRDVGVTLTPVKPA